MSKSNDVAGEFYILDWTSEVDKHEAYIAALEYIISLYKSNSYFRLDVARSTAKVLGKDSTSSERESGKQVKENISVLKVELSKSNYLRNLSIFVFVHLFSSVFVQP